ncbi:ATP-binding protein [Kamptonema sp. UHCC 0994]|uniref:ATP-binding protein n=1 Tax=Kamptonema sp. UHCC 0994 TaxID=3031329 RepID=UPI0023B97158|nr:ATP-binding protein [Kamptonema sp. UHCC 0994]MDF0555719.1 ATP-binding protein [Kamptonema sp. UHCC 0994]
MENMIPPIWDIAGVGICVTDEEGQFVEVNLAYSQLCGWSVAELLGESPESSGVGSSGCAIALKGPKNLQDTLIAGSSQQADLGQIICKDGDRRDVWVIATPLVREDNRQFQVTTVTDITNVLRTGDRAESQLNQQNQEQLLKEKDLSQQTLPADSQTEDRLSTLESEIGIAIAQSTTLPEILNRCTETIMHAFDATFVGIWIFNRATRLLELQAFVGEQPPTAEFSDRIPFGISTIGFVAQYRQPYIIPAQENKTLASYPLIVEDRLVGVVVVACRQAVAERGGDLLGWAANAIAIAIDRARSWAGRESLLFRLASQIRNSLELDTILETAVQEIHSLLQLDWCLFMWYRPEVIKNEELTIKNQSTDTESAANYSFNSELKFVTQNHAGEAYPQGLELQSTKLWEEQSKLKQSLNTAQHYEGQSNLSTPHSVTRREALGGTKETEAISQNHVGVAYPQGVQRSNLQTQNQEGLRVQLSNLKTQNSYWEVVKEATNPGLPTLIGRYPVEKVGSFTEKLLNLEIIRLDDVAGFEEPVMRRFLMSWGYASILALPIQTHSGAIGAFSCGMYNPPKSDYETGSEFADSSAKLRPWSDSEVELLRAVTDQLAIAIDQAELYAQARNNAEIAQTQAQQIAETFHKLQATQTQLIQTEKMSSLGSMVAGVAHEINNPINFISGNLTYAIDYIQDLLDLLHLYQKHSPNPDPEIQEKTNSIDLEFLTADLPKLISSMKLGTDRIRQIVMSLRNFSRLDESEKKPVDIHEGIDSTLLILQHKFNLYSGKLSVKIIKEYGNLPLVECCAGQLNQVFMNIISNAIDALENQPEPRIITIRTAVMNGKGEENYLSPITDDKFAVIRISDNGPGMTEPVINRSFDPFFTTKPVGKGTGLGLSISHHIIVEKHAGILKCISEPGKGAEFWIQIPLA